MYCTYPSFHCSSSLATHSHVAVKIKRLKTSYRRWFCPAWSSSYESDCVSFQHRTQHRLSPPKWGRHRSANIVHSASGAACCSRRTTNAEKKLARFHRLGISFIRVPRALSMGKFKGMDPGVFQNLAESWGLEGGSPRWGPGVHKWGPEAEAIIMLNWCTIFNVLPW